MTGGPEYVYRIVKTPAPALDDFLSATAKGRRPSANTPPERLRLWDGVSVYDSADEARRTSSAFPWLGRYLAELRLTGSEHVRWEKTLGPAHYTLWGEPETLRACVVRVLFI